MCSIVTHIRGTSITFSDHRLLSFDTLVMSEYYAVSTYVTGLAIFDFKKLGLSLETNGSKIDHSVLPECSPFSSRESCFRSFQSIFPLFVWSYIFALLSSENGALSFQHARQNEPKIGSR